MTTKPTRAAVMQIEIDTKRWAATKENNDFIGLYDETPWKRIYNIAKTAVCDTIHNGGTFVVVCIPGGKITMVQRPDAEDI